MIAEEREILETTGATVVETEGDKDADILAHTREADAVMIVSAYLRGPVIRQFARCKVISRLGTGVDKIDVEQATRQGILVANLPDFCTEEVADHTMALLLAAARRLKYFDEQMRQGNQPRDTRHMRRLSTQTLGVIGLGRIGRAVARRARAFGMKVLALDPQLSVEDAARESIIPASLATILAQSDYVCLLCPLLPSTRRMLGMNEFRQMKRSAVLVNTGRGELINEEDLVTALREGLIRYAALDVFAGINVFATTGFPTSHPFFELENALLTPHIASCSQESLLECRVRGAGAVADVLRGKWPAHLVNPNVKPWFPLGNM